MAGFFVIEGVWSFVPKSAALLIFKGHAAAALYGSPLSCVIEFVPAMTGQ